MVYLKSAVMGLCTLMLFIVVLIVVSPFIIVPILSYQVRRQFPNQTLYISWHPISLVKHSPAAWLLLFLAFAIGFGWRYRQLTRQSRLIY